MSVMPPKLVLYDFPAETGVPGWESFSPFVIEISRALHLAGLTFEHQRIQITGLRRLNPIGQLPVLGIGVELVADSTRILHRIEQLAPGSLTGGLDRRGVAEAWLWEEFADTALYPYPLVTRWYDERGWHVPRGAFFGAIPAPLRGTIANLVRRKTKAALVGRDFTRGGLDAAYERMRRVLDSLEARAPSEGFWMGPRACVADLGLFAQLHALRFPGTQFQADEVARRGALSRYLDRVDKVTRT
jgi:glutathione S-transferase